jgi:hypothetical protein
MDARIAAARALHTHRLTFQEPTRVADRLWLGSFFDAMDVEFLRGEGITHVVNCADRLPRFETYTVKEADLRAWIVLNADDDRDYPILERHLDTVTEFIDSALLELDSKVLVHCRAGVNRSATLVLAYAALRLPLPLPLRSSRLEAFATVFEHVMERRPMILSNEGFYKQLVEWAHREP